MITPVNIFNDNDDLVEDSDESLQITHSLSNLFLHKQSVSDKMVVICVKSLIGAYGYVSMINKTFITFQMPIFFFFFLL